MAEQENTTIEHGGAQQAAGDKGGRGKIVPWLIMLLAVAVCAGAGFLVGRLFGARGAAAASGAAKAPPSTTNVEASISQAATGRTWFHDLEPVVANLNEPGVTRYVRVSLTLEIGNGLEQKEGQALFEQKKPLLKHWLTLYLANQTLEDIRGENNLRRMQSQIADALNQGLFLDSKPRIVRILFKEWSSQ
jgi:flagellar basal body-associated protein FliL